MERNASRKRSSDNFGSRLGSEPMPLASYDAIVGRNSSGGKIPRIQALCDATSGSSESDSSSVVLTAVAAMPGRSAHAVATVRMTAAAGADADADAAEHTDDKVLRRRLQYKMHQRRHRAKQKAKIESLEHDVHSLLSDVASLEAQVKRLQTRNVFAARGTAAGQPMRVMLEYFRVYEHGWSPQHWSEQEWFLQCVASSTIEGPDYVGVDTIKDQWRLYGHFFAATRYDIHGYDVSRVDDLTVIVVNVTLSIRPRRDGVTSLCPSLVGHEELIQDIIGNAIVVPGKSRFIFDADGRVSWLGADMDFVSGLQRTLGSLSKVARVMRNARLSFGTGQIRCEPSGSAVDLYRDVQSQNQRHHVEYLLS